ncbi:MAG: hypothetical protein C5B50_10725 [Verrucomicrobia bacterium]|nr:MAG: hypothetical protein C5B50_10725 [Verrucomicrobiota bacterium]
MNTEKHGLANTNHRTPNNKEASKKANNHGTGNSRVEEGSRRTILEAKSGANKSGESFADHSTHERVADSGASNNCCLAPHV